MVPLPLFIRRANQWFLWGNLRLDLLHIKEDGLKLDRHVSLPIRRAIFLDVFRYAAFAFGYAQQISQITRLKMNSVPDHELKWPGNALDTYKALTKHLLVAYKVIHTVILSD